MSDMLRYVAPWSRWMLWTGTLWEFDETLKAFNKVRRVCRAAANAANKSGSVIASAKTVRAVEKQPGPIVVLPQRLISGTLILGCSIRRLA